jgi:hypothetical protein
MPRHAAPADKKSMSSLPRPVQDNTPHASTRVQVPKGKAAEGGRNESPQASSMPGSLPIIKNPQAKSGAAHGVPGIINSTTTSPETRLRLIQGVLDLAESAGSSDQGAVHTMMGHDSTAYNMGMVHIRGSKY